MLRRLLTTFVSPKKETIVSSHEQSEGKLEFSELRYRRLFETAQDGILILDAVTGKIADANPFLKQLLGYSQAELLGKELWEIGVFKDIVGSKTAFRQLQTKGYIRYKDLPLQTKDGRSIAVEFVSNVYAVGNQKVIQCNIRDITDRKKVEEAIKIRTQDLERLDKAQEKTKQAMLNVMEDLEQAKATIEVEKAKDEAMLASIGEGLIAVDNDRKIIIINKAAEHMLGFAMGDLMGRKITSLRLEDEEGNLISLDKSLFRVPISADTMTSNTYFFVRKDKTRFPTAINVTPIKLGGKTIGTIDIFRDITRERETDRAKSEFVSLASHQLRTPLGIAKWYIEAIKEEGYLKNAPEIAKDYLNEIYKSNERLVTLVRELLSISRIEQGKIRNTPKLTNITNLITEVIKAMSILAAKNNITIHLDLRKPDIQPIFIDPLRVQEIIENLIANAISYSNASGKVEIIVDAKDNMVLIAVKDTGIGMSSEDKKNLYTKFYRSEKAIGHNPEGSGLGLYVVKSYVEGWGGKISVQSVEGKGSTFTVSLPISQKDEKGLAPSKPER